MLKKWKTTSSKVAFNNKWMQVIQETVELPNGRILDDYFMWDEGQIVIIVPVTKNNELVLVRQYKHAYGDMVLEFPAGWMDENEVQAEAARRELQEETGYSSAELNLIETLVTRPTKVRGKLHIYLATNVVANSQTAFDENEEIEIVIKSYSEVARMIYTGEIITTATISAFFLAAKKLRWEL